MVPGSHKRARLSPEPYGSIQQAQSTASSYNAPPSGKHTPTSGTSTSSNATSSFRNVSACNRCRLRKNRCDQNLPACTACEKAGVKCVGFDPITKRQIPRTYVYFLESRVTYLEGLCSANGVPFAPAASDFDLGSKPVIDAANSALSPSSESSHANAARSTGAQPSSNQEDRSEVGSEWEQKEENDKLTKLVSNIGMVSVQGASDPRYLGSTSGISFARVVFAAIKSSINDKNGGRGSRAGSISSAAAATNGTSMRDSFFGLSTKPNIRPAPFPDRVLGMKLMTLYFEHANPQIPILHRGEFLSLFGRAYATKDRQRSSRELYLLNIVFAIGAAIILPDAGTEQAPDLSAAESDSIKQESDSTSSTNRARSTSQQQQPEEYHASAMIHLEAFMGAMPASDRPEGFGGGLEQLQAVLLLAGFALLRPVAPGLWYIVGVAVRLGVDLGLHYEDKNIEEYSVPPSSGLSNASTENPTGIDAKERGRREWTRDLRRRLWWCVYSFDRLVSTCVGRPFGVTDQVITTQWYTVLDDKDITTEGFLTDPNTFKGPSPKRVGHHYLRLRLLQSEILQVLQHRQTHTAQREAGRPVNPYMHTRLSCPFLEPFDGSFHSWRTDIDKRLWEWKESAPLASDTTVHFNVRFLELNYWQLVIVLYRQSLSVPESFAGEVGPHTEVESPLTPFAEDHEDEEDIFLKVAEAGQRVLKLYLELHKVHLVNYTYLATVHLFMAGIAFLYSIWHSPIVRARLALQDVEFTVRAGTSVLSDLTDKCPPAEACRDAFERMSKATIKMCQRTTGFGSQIHFNREVKHEPATQPHYFERPSTMRRPLVAGDLTTSRPPPTFDYNLRDLFAEQAVGMSGGSSSQWPTQQQLQQVGQQSRPQLVFHTPSYSSQEASTSTQDQDQRHDQFLAGSNIAATNPASSFNTASHTGTTTQNERTFNPAMSSDHSPIMSMSNVSAPPVTSSDNNPTLYPHQEQSTLSLPVPTATSTISNDPFSFDHLLANDLSPLPPTYSTSHGLNVGFDGRHDWADGTTNSGQGLPDLFGNFFFGTGGAYAGGGPVGMGVVDGMGDLEGLDITALAGGGGSGAGGGGGSMEGIIVGGGSGGGTGADGFGSLGGTGVAITGGGGSEDGS